MLKKLLVPALLLGAAFTAAPAQAQVRFGVGIGGPVYAPAYPYYSAPYYGYYGYPGPYVYGYYGHGWYGRGWYGRGWYGHGWYGRRWR
jgi:hypothetical protein